jgi:hypothetical protein
MAAAAAQTAPVVSFGSLFLKSPADAPRLRVGVILPVGTLHAPTMQIITALRAADFIELVASIHVQPRAPHGSPEPLLYRLYRCWDQAVHASSMLSAHAAASLPNELARFEAQIDPAGTRLTLSDSERAALEACRLDVLLVLGSVPLAAGLESCARFGLWRNDLGDPILGERVTRQLSKTLQQVAPLTISLHALLSGRPQPITLASAALPLISSVSTVRNLTGIAAMAQDTMQSKLWQVHALGWDEILGHAQTVTQESSVEPSRPSNWRMVRWLAPKAVRHLRHRIRLRNTVESWCVGLRRASGLAGLQAATFTGDIHWLDIPPGHYQADPFLMEQGGRSYLFVEDFDVAADLGSIACLPLDNGVVSGPAQTVLERPYHLSYPQVFGCDGEIFMIPESGYNNTVELYRALSFPDKWQLERVLFRGPAFDVTLLRHAGRFWFFVTLIDKANPQRIELLLFHSHSLLGDWSLHPRSPISRDIRTARCAGSPFLDSGSWIRPAQDGSTTYGGSLRYQRIVQLDVRHYVEEFAGGVTAAMLPGMTGVHTYNRAGELEVFDAKRRLKMPPVRA